MTTNKDRSVIDRIFTFWLYLAAMFFISSWLDDSGWGWQALDIFVAALTLHWAVQRTIRHAHEDRERTKDDEKVEL